MKDAESLEFEINLEKTATIWESARFALDYQGLNLDKITLLSNLFS